MDRTHHDIVRFTLEILGYKALEDGETVEAGDVAISTCGLPVVVDNSKDSVGSLMGLPVPKLDGSAGMDVYRKESEEKCN